MTTTTTNPYPDVPLPAGSAAPWGWQPHAHNPPFRMVYGVERAVTDHEARVRPRAWQNSDGTLDEMVVSVDLVDDLNSDQARELAAALLEAADEVDGWTAR